jgi:CheY-like chemotaxis protein
MWDDPTILLAEDDPDDALITQITFRKARLANRLEVVRDGEQAIAYLKGEGRYADRCLFPFPMLLLLDLHMPKVDGFEVLEWLRKPPSLPHLSVAVLTSSDHDPDARRAFELGADSYLIKPPDAGTLLELVQRLHAFWLIVDERPELQAA